MISGRAGQQFDRSYINYDFTECEMFSIRDTIARLVESRHEVAHSGGLNAPAFDRVRDCATEAVLDYKYTCILDTEVELPSPRYSIALA